MEDNAAVLDHQCFDPQATACVGNGPRNMRAGTELKMESAPGKGCAVHLKGPVG